MDRIQIFEDIAEIITNDYAGAEEVQFPIIYENFVRLCSILVEQHRFNDEDLNHLVQLYLQAIGDRSLKFNIKDHAGFQKFQRGFSVRSDGKDLFVSEVNQEERVRLGDKVITISYQPPARYRSSASQFDRVRPISERDLWDAFLNHARVIEVQHEDGSQEKVILNRYALSELVPELACRKLDPETVFLRIESFVDKDPVIQLLEAHKDLLTSCSRLIIDLRKNSGGDREAIFPLLPYVCDRDMTVNEFFQDEVEYTRFSERNCDLSKLQLAPYLEVDDVEVRDMARVFTEDLDSKRGRGFLPEAGDETNQEIKSIRSADKIILLTDTYCEGEAESFALGCRRTEGTTLVGRPTMGNFEYRNPVTVDYGFGKTFTYPISKTKRCFDGNGYSKSGVPVDVYIPWSGDEIRNDIILDEAMSL